MLGSILNPRGPSRDLLLEEALCMGMLSHQFGLTDVGMWIIQDFCNNSNYPGGLSDQPECLNPSCSTTEKCACVSQDNSTSISKFHLGSNPYVGWFNSHYQRYCCCWHSLIFCSANGANDTYGTGDDIKWCSAGLMHPAQRTTWVKVGDTIKSGALFRVFLFSVYHLLFFLPQLFYLLSPDHCLPLFLFFTGFLSSVSSYLSQIGHKLNEVWHQAELLNCIKLSGLEIRSREFMHPYFIKTWGLFSLFIAPKTFKSLETMLLIRKKNLL